MTDWSTEAWVWYWIITGLLLLLACLNVWYGIRVFVRYRKKKTAKRNSRPPTPNVGHLEINDHVWLGGELWTMTNYTPGVAGEDNRPPRIVMKVIEPVENWPKYL